MKTPKSKRYLTGDGWTDSFVGFFAGLIFYWFVIIGVMNGILSHLLPPGMEFFLGVVIDCVITLLIALLLWCLMRLRYYLPLVNAMFFAGFLLCGLFFYIFWVFRGFSM